MELLERRAPAWSLAAFPCLCVNIQPLPPLLPRPWPDLDLQAGLSTCSAPQRATGGSEALSRILERGTGLWRLLCAGW